MICRLCEGLVTEHGDEEDRLCSNCKKLRDSKFITLKLDEPKAYKIKELIEKHLACENEDFDKIHERLHIFIESKVPKHLRDFKGFE